jgi:hypothetical protein
VIRAHWIWLLFWLMLSAPFHPVFSRTWYVKVDGSGDAPTIQAAIDSASAGDDVVVAAGTYTWTNQGTTGDHGLILFARDVTGIDLLSESGPEVTILDAEDMGRVMYFEAYTTNLVEGFTITGGDAPMFGDFAGGGMALHLNYSTFRNCIILGNNAQQGGGAWVGGVCTTQFEDCIFKWNTALIGAGAIVGNSSELVWFNNCTFMFNSAGMKGGGIYAYHHYFALDNCTIYSNTAVEKGGGLYCELIWPSSITNCTFSENAAPDGSGICMFGSSTLYVNNTILCHGALSPAISRDTGSQLYIGCSNTYGNNGGDTLPPHTGFNNFSLNPQFCGILGSHYYHLQSDSPCAPGNHPEEFPCGLIGSSPVSCDFVPVRQATWGEIKAIYGR